MTDPGVLAGAGILSAGTGTPPHRRRAGRNPGAEEKLPGGGDGAWRGFM